MITIKSATIYDGISEKPFNGDLSVRGERIAELSDNSHSEPGGRRISRFFPFTNVQGQNDKRLRGIKEINASGQLLLPGFIDIHSHADLNIYQEPSTNPKLRQGVTTEITGNCGFSIIPLPLGEMDKGEGYLARRVSAWIKMWKGIWGKPPAGYPDKKPAQNVFSLLGYGTLRYLISGLENRPFTRRETEFAKKIITASIKEGAVGLSLGMVYPPCAFSTKEELLIMATVVARAGGYLSVHLRNEGDAVEEAILEVIEIARRTGVRLQISHFKCYGRKNWHKFDGLLEIIEKENSRGLEINFDIYPYTAGSTTLATLLPNWVREGSREEFIKRLRDPQIVEKIEKEIKKDVAGRENYLRETLSQNIIAIGLKSKKYRKYEGESLYKIAKCEKKTVIQSLCDLLINEDGAGEMLMFGMSEKNIRKAMKSKYSMFGTDGLFGGRPHPRTYGTYPRIIQKYVLQEKTLTMQEAVKKMSVMPAQKARIPGRGVLKPGNFADFVIIDPKKIREKSTYTNPEQFPAGIDAIFINGKKI